MESLLEPFSYEFFRNGLLAATLIAVFIIPVLFVAAERIGQRLAGTGVSPVTPPLPAHGDR